MAEDVEPLAPFCRDRRSDPGRGIHLVPGHHIRCTGSRGGRPAIDEGILRTPPGHQPPCLRLHGTHILGPLIHFGNKAHKASLSYAANPRYEVAIFTPGTPWVLVVLSIAGLLLYVIVRRLRGRDRSLWLLAAPAVFGALGVLFLVASELSVSSRISYYGHKFAAGVFGMCLVVLMTVLVGSFATSKLRRRLPTVATALLACLASIALLEIDGYVGPFANGKRVTLATGFSAHKVIDAASVGSGEAEDLIASARFAQDRPTSGTRWAYMIPVPGWNAHWLMSGSLDSAMSV